MRDLTTTAEGLKNFIRPYFLRIEVLEKENAALQAQLSSALDREKKLREALTPSASTKAAFIGEFHFFTEGSGSMVTVPWTTTKEIMSAILARALSEKPEGET